MSKRFFAVAFAIGLAILAWVAFGFVGASWLALAMTAAIAAVYLLGAFELRQFRSASAALAAALADMPQPVASVADWLERVPPTLRNAVRLRIEGERAGLPGPALTPYLVGLLVMLGMLGTFLGMVLTFKGAVFALEGSADLQTMRAALAEPIKGLGLAFGTSVAGVAASAMLGLMSAISRRERLEVGRQLDSRIATVLRPFSLVHQRAETFRAVQAQAGALPAVVDKLEALMERIERRSEQLDQHLLGRQADFHRDVTLAYTGLAQAVGGSLQDSLAAGARAVGDTIRPAVESAMAQIVQETERMHLRLADAFDQRGSALLAAVGDHLARSHSDQALAERQRLQGWTQALQALGAELAGQWRQVGEQTIAHQQAVCLALERTAGEVAERTSEQTGRTLAEVAQLLARSEDLVRTRMETEAQWMAQLRGEMSRLAERDNLALAERTVLLEQLGALLRVVTQASGEQRSAVEALVASASSVLEQAGHQFAQELQAHGGRTAETATHVNASALELASLGEAFGHSVQLFQASTDKLMETLQRIEASINRSTARSDEQLAYYVAQAREVIDLSIASQQGMVDHLRQLQVRPLALADGGRG